MKSDWSLFCADCGRTKPLNWLGRCECGGPLELVGPLGRVDPAGRRMVGRYGSFFPFASGDWTSLGEGGTPLVPLARLGRRLNLSALWAKNETTNPTWSFKDRGTAVCLAHAKSLGFDRIGTVSTGNMAASVAAYGAASGSETFILVKRDMPEEKLAPVAVYGARVVRVDGPYDKLYDVSLELGRRLGIYFMNSDVPFRVAGSRTIAYELAEEAPTLDWVVVPVSAGGNIRGIFEGYRLAVQMGLVQRAPRILAVQAAGCCPVTAAFESGAQAIRRFENPSTVAHAIDNPLPPSGNRALSLLRSDGGAAVAASEDEILSAQRDLCAEGLFVQPGSATAFAGLKLALARGIISAGSQAAVVLTGSGLKYQSVLEKHGLSWESCGLDELEKILR